MYRTVDTKFWTDPKVRRLPPMEKLLFLYCLTCPHSHVSGIFYLPLVLIQHETGLPLEEVEYGIDTLSEAYLIRFDTTNEVLWVRHMLRYQPKGDKIRQAVASQLHNLHNCSLIKEFLEEYADIKIPYQYPIETASSQEQEQEQIQEQDQKYVPPYPPMNGMVDTEAIDNFQQRYNQPPQLHDDEATVLTHLNKITGRQYTDPGHIRTRLRDGAKVAECLLVLDWLHIVRRVENPKWVEQYLDNDTPFRDKVNFGKYLARAQPWHEGGRHPPQETTGQAISAKGLRNMASTNRILAQLRKDTHD